MKYGVSFLTNVRYAWRWIVPDIRRWQGKRVDLQRNAFFVESVRDDLRDQLLLKFTDVEKSYTDAGVLAIHVPADEFTARTATGRAPSADEWVGTGRELFASMRAAVGPADEGASVFRSIS